MRQYLIEFTKDFAYPTQCAEELLGCYDAIVGDAKRGESLNALLADYTENCKVSYFVLEEYVKSICDGFSYHEYTVWLLVYVLMSRRLQELYLQEGISQEIWRESMNDLKFKLEECRLLHGIWGIFVASWFPNFYRLKRFAFGRLQMEIATYHGETFVCGDGGELKEGDPVLAVHIPRSPMPLSEENCNASYRAAADFFAERFEGDAVTFTCNSWMLYPKHSEFLHPRSNVRRFGEDFELMSATHNAEGVYPDLWRIFDVECNGDYSKLPEDSFLRRAYKEYVLSGGVTGRGYGVKRLPKSNS